MTADAEPIALGVARTLYREKKLIPFIGAGVSAQLGLPTSAELIKIIADELGWDPEVLRLSGDLDQIGQYFVQQRGNIGKLRSLLDQAFTRSDHDVERSRTLMTLARAGFPLIYTTNYDRLIEQAHRIAGRRVRAINGFWDFHRIAGGETLVVKFHGSLSEDTSIVLTEDSYFRRLELQDPLDIKLRSDMLGKSLMFLGYSYQDPNVRYMAYKFAQLQGTTRRPGDVRPDPFAILLTFGTSEVALASHDPDRFLVCTLDPLDRDASLAGFLEQVQQ